MNQLAQVLMEVRKARRKQFIAYLIKWQCGTPVIYLCMTGLPFKNELLKTVLANIIGALIFFPIDIAIFNKTKMEGNEHAGSNPNEETTV